MGVAAFDPYILGERQKRFFTHNQNDIISRLAKGRRQLSREGGGNGGRGQKKVVEGRGCEGDAVG